MQDSEVVAAIVGGDPQGIAEAYDRYAMPVYSYCRSMLREPADAADAVQDTFVIAASKLAGLKDPGKLRPWLFAVARNECLRLMRSGRAVSGLDQADELPAEAADVSQAAERAELRDLVRDAVRGLNPAERDVIDLNLAHGFEGHDLADVLGVSANHAHALLSRARSQLERSLGALLVARTGRAACPALDAMLAGWDGRMTVLMRKRISRHIERCETCGERKRRELSPAMLAGVVPLVAMMAGFRDQVLRICADHTPAGLAHRASVTTRAGSFGPAGFPKPVRPPGWQQARWPLHAAASTAAAGTAAAVGAVLFIGGVHPGGTPAHGAGVGAPPGSVVTTGAPVRGGSTPFRRGTLPAGGGSALAPSAVGPGVVTVPGGTVGPSTPKTPGSTGSAPEPSASASASASIQGTLAVSLSRLVLVAVNGHGIGTFTLTAKGGPVTYHVSAPSGLAVSPASGSLASGASAAITVRSASLITLDEQLTVSPGGTTVTVVLNLSL